MTMNMTPITQAQIMAARQMERKMRKPAHPFYCHTQPFQIMPFFIAPVLAGETMKNLSLQARVVTDPILNPIIGWWQEYYFFYVKLTDLQEDVATEMPKMLIDPAWAGLATVTAAAGGTVASKPHFYGSGGVGQINWVELCRRVCVRHYFRDEKDDYTAFTIGGHPVAQFNMKNVLDSVENASDVLGSTMDVDVEGPDANTTIQASEVMKALEQYNALYLANMVDMTFDQYLAAFGIKQPSSAIVRPELVRYVRDWQYPSNTIDPTNGTPRSAVSWSISERADKARLFSEPGFLFGLSVTRPKVYLRNQTGSFTSSMNDLRTWLPPWLMKSAQSSFKAVVDNVGPLASLTDTAGYVFDVKDLFLYGEQFVNVDMTTVALNDVNSPTPALGNSPRYPNAATDIEDAFFVTPATAKYIKMDGIVNLTIASRDAATDTSPRGGQVLQLL